MVVSSGEGQKLDARGVPSFAQPWVELGRLEEREKWQKLAMELMETSISSELVDLKGTLATNLPRLPELKQNINTKVDDAQGRISHLIAQYKKFFLEESSVEDLQNPDRNKIIAAQATSSSSQYTALSYGSNIWERSAGSTSEIVIEEDD